MWGAPTDASDGRTRKASPVEAVIGIAMLAGSVAIFPTVGVWPEIVLAFASILAFCLSIICVAWSFKIREKIWMIASLFGVIIFNPILKFTEDNSWGVFGIIVSIGFFRFGYELIDKQISRTFSYTFGVIGAILLALTYYVNHYLPRGTMLPTGDIVCMNDGRGPCGESRVEELSELDIPEWAKFLRSNLIWTMLFFGVSTIVLANKPIDIRHRKEEFDR